MKQNHLRQMNLKKWTIYKKIYMTIILVFLILISFFIYYYVKTTHIRFVKDMKAGWNLGNTLDAHGVVSLQNSGETEIYETYWGNPITTKEMIDEIKKGGFNTVRIPVTWYEHMDQNGVIDPKWMDRVQEVVDYVIKNDMYAIINIHHDTWFMPTYENKEKSKKMLSFTWLQIARRFADYDNHLIFESMNEPRLIGTKYEWTEGTNEAREVVNELNLAFLETIRNASNNNKTRYLMISPYCNSSEDKAINDLNLLDDKRIIVSIHQYAPFEFAMKDDGTKVFNKNDPKETEKIDKAMDNLYNKFIKKGIPVIISEFGAVDKNNLKYRLEWADYYVKSARKKNIMCIWWDEGSKQNSKGRYELFDRHNLKWKYPEIVDILVSKN